jgi:hypothetical protein
MVIHFIRKAIYTRSSNLEGFDFGHMLTYSALGWIFRHLYFNNNGRDIAHAVAGSTGS